MSFLLTDGITQVGDLFCILFIRKMPQKQRANACFSFKNQVTPPIFKTGV
jgi:hypothetical protein